MAQRNRPWSEVGGTGGAAGEVVGVCSLGKVVVLAGFWLFVLVVAGWWIFLVMRQKCCSGSKVLFM